MSDFKLSPKQENLLINIFFGLFGLFIFLIVLRYVLSAKTLKQNEAYLDSLAKNLQTSQEPVLQTPILNSSDPRLGQATAANTIVVYSDFQCPYCAEIMATLAQVLKQHQDQVMVIWKDFPNPVHPQAKSAALAARCAQLQGKFWEYHDYLFSNQEKLGDDLYQEIAGKLALNVNVFSQCLVNQATLPLVEAGFNEAVALELDATPYLFINGQRISGQASLADLEKMLQ